MSMLSSALFASRANALASTSRTFSTTRLSAAKARKADASLGGLRKSPLVRIQGPMKTFKPITPSIRHLKQVYNPHLFSGPPIRLLTLPKRKTGGRNNSGRISVRSVGGGHKQRIRILDFHRLEPGKCDVVRIEFDPGRSAHIALIANRNPRAKTVLSYILAPDGIRAGDVVESFRMGIPDGLVDGYVDERRWERHGKAMHNALDPGMHRLGHTTTPFAEVIAPVEPESAQLEVEETGVDADLLEVQRIEDAAEVVADEVESALDLAAAPESDPTDVLGDVALDPAPEPGLEPASAEASSWQEPTEEALPPPSSPFQAPTHTPTPPPPTTPHPDLAQAHVQPSAQSASTTSQLALGHLRALTIKPGNVLPLRLIPGGVLIHSISLHPYGPGKLVRSAGSSAEIVAHNEDGKYSQVRLQSGEVRLVGQECCATIGKVSNEHWKSRQLGKAGRARNLGRRPHVRGVAMNAVDHPHGGGRGKSKGNKHPRSIYGWLTKGRRTRKPGPKGHKGGNRFVVKERPRGKQRKQGPGA